MKTKQTKDNKQRLKVLKGEGRRFSFANFKQAVVFYILLLLALVIIVQLGYHWLGGQFLSWRLQVIEAEAGIMQQEARVTGMITRQEEAFFSPADGMILRLAEAGERVSAGAELVTVGTLSRADLQSLRGSEEEEPDLDLWEQLNFYWEKVFPGEDLSGVTPDSAKDEPETAEGVEQEITRPDSSAFIDIITLYTEKPGMISHYIDGFEAYNGAHYLVQSPAEEEDGEGGSYFLEGDLVESGEAIVKIVDNWNWHYCIIMPLHPGRAIAGLQRITIDFDFVPGQLVPAELSESEIDEGKQEVRLTYLIQRQLPGFDQARWAEATLLYRQERGIIVPANAIIEKETGPGLFINQGGRVVFKEIIIIERQEEQVMVEGVAPQSLVITRPDLVEEGQRLN